MHSVGVRDHQFNSIQFNFISPCIQILGICFGILHAGYSITKLSPARDLHGRYTSAIGQGGRQDGKTRLREELQHNMRKGRRKKRRPPDYAPRGVQCGSRKKTPQHISTYILQHDRTQDLQRGEGRGDGGKPAQTSSHLVQQP